MSVLELDKPTLETVKNAAHIIHNIDVYNSNARNEIYHAFCYYISPAAMAKLLEHFINAPGNAMYFEIEEQKKFIVTTKMMVSK
jgi:hypothetical protein